MLYTTTVIWGTTEYKHKSWSKTKALVWAYQYPKEELFVKVKSVFGKTLLVRYYH